MMTEKVFNYIESEMYNCSFRSVIEALITSCDIPRVVNSHVTMQRPFLGRNLVKNVSVVV